MSQPILADILGVSQSEKSKIENDQTKKIDFLFMDKVCKEFDKDFDFFTENQIDNIKKLNDCINNHGTINVSPENIIDQIKIIFEENSLLKEEINNLKLKK